MRLMTIGYVIESTVMNCIHRKSANWPGRNALFSIRKTFFKVWTFASFCFDSVVIENMMENIRDEKNPKNTSPRNLLKKFSERSALYLNVTCLIRYLNGHVGGSVLQASFCHVPRIGFAHRRKNAKIFKIIRREFILNS